MADQITTTVRTISGTPDRDDPDNFNTQSDDFFEDLPGAITDINAVAGEMNTVATSVEADAAAAETAQAAAIAASGATEWLIGTTYDDGDVVWGSDSATYRAAQGSNTGHDPVGDGGTWWVEISNYTHTGDVTGATALTIGTDKVLYTHTIGSSKSLTPVTDSAANFAANFTGANLYGGTFICNVTGTCQLPLMVAGMNFTIITLGAIEVVADTNAADGYLMDGTTNAEGKNLTNLSTAGDIAVFQYYTADDWLITTNGWTAEA